MSNINEELYQLAISKPLGEKIDKAVAIIQHYEGAAKTWDMFEPWYHFCNSYGKDSVWAEYLLKLSGVAYQGYHNLTTLDAPEMIQFGREHFPDTNIIKPARPMLQQMWMQEGQGPPTRLARWCCELYKEGGCKNQIKVFGIRAAESPRRKENWKQWQNGLRNKDDSWILNPILYFTDDDVWNGIHNNNVPYCSVYDEVDANGKKLFTRMGCIGCPMAGKGRFTEFERWPKIEAAWKRAFEKFWDKWHGRPLLRPRWVSMEGKYPFKPIDGEREEMQWVKKTGQEEHGFWTMRRWYDLREFEKWEDLWHWWMQDEEEAEGCSMGLH